MVMSVAKSDRFEIQLYPHSSHEWYTFGDNINAHLFLNQKKARPIGKVTARLRCVQIVRLPKHQGCNSQQFHMEAIERYNGPEIPVIDLTGHKLAAKSHRYPISFVIPSEIKALPPSYDDWYTGFGKSEWYGAKWFLELNESTDLVISEEIPIRVFPKGSLVTPTPLTRRIMEKSFDVKLPPLPRSQKLLQVGKYDRCQVMASMQSSTIVYAGQLPELCIAIRTDIRDVAVLYKVVVSLRSRAKTSIDNWTNISESTKVLAKWYPDIPIDDEVDITSEILANLREQKIWQYDITTDMTSVTHFLDFRAIVLGKWNPGFNVTLRLTSPIRIAAPWDGSTNEEVLPAYSVVA